VATLETGSRLVSCAGSTKGLTATNQEVASSSLAGRANRLIHNLPSRAESAERLVRFTRRRFGRSGRRFPAHAADIRAAGAARFVGAVSQSAGGDGGAYLTVITTFARA
jgi:hypothetical protein